MTTDERTAAPQDLVRWVAPLDAEEAAGALAHVLGTGDLYQLTNDQRLAHFINLCRSGGLNPLSNPYQWIEFKESESARAVLTLYLKPTAAAQALRNHGISVHYPRREVVGELFVVEAHGTAADGRTGVGTKYVPLTNKYGRLNGRHLANAYMSAESGALRRLALNMGVVAAPGPDKGDGSMRVVTVDGTGAVIANPTEEQRHLAEHPEVARAIGEPTLVDTASTMPEVDVDLPDQRPRRPAPAPQKPAGPRPSFNRSPEGVNRLLGAWFAAVGDTSLRSDDARARYVASWTKDEWPENKRTDSLRTFFARATDDEAGDLLAHTRAIVEGEKLARQDGSQPEMGPPDEEAEPF